jgi:hypothetical protein
MYGMMAGRLPLHDPDEYRLQHKIRCHEVKYPMGISKEVELTMTRYVSLILRLKHCKW